MSPVVRSAVAVTGVSLSPTSLTITEGENETLNAIVAPANATNQVVTWSSSNAAIATVDANGEVTAIAEGNAVITVTTNDGNFTAQSSIEVSPANTNACSASGTILMERYDDISGFTISDLTSATNYPDTPSLSSQLSLFEIPRNTGDSYGVRVSGYICAPETGTYYFFVAGNNHSEISLSTDTNEANKVRLAYHEEYASNRQWDKFSTQKSQGILLNQGDSYYIEALMKEGSGGDNLAVGWRRPSDGNGTVATEVIPGAVLSASIANGVSSLRAVIEPSAMLSLSPVPASTTLNVDYYFINDSDSEINLVIFDNLGRQVFNRSYAEDDFNKQIDISNLPSGTYFLRLSKDDEQLMKQFLVK